MASIPSSSARPLWQPLADSGHNVKRFVQQINQEHGIDLKSYHDLWEWSVDPATAPRFWLALYRFLDIQSDRAPQIAIQAVPGAAAAALYPPPVFFPDVRLNFTENIFAKYQAQDVILHLVPEGGATIRDLTWSELRAQVRRVASALAASGVAVGDRVASVISNRLETIVGCLATLSLGAIWSSTSPDMGAAAVLDRLGQIRPKVVFCESEIVYNGKRRNLLPRHRQWAQDLARQVADLQAVVVMGGAAAADVVDVSALQGDGRAATTKMTPWAAFVSRGAPGRSLSFVRLPFNHPAFIVYSSGTSGPPKCIVHSAGGLLMQVRKDALLSYDVRPGDTILQYTTTGWIMWAMVLVSLSYGGRVVVYDGSPMVPDAMVLLRLVERLRVTLLGTSAKFLTHLKGKDLRVRELADLSSLRTVTSTGSTLTADVAEWFYDHAFPASVHLLSTCGGTDLACSLVSGVPTEPLYAGEIQGPSLGMAVDIFGMDDGAPAESIRASGAAGEVVCTQPFPSQPVCFWGDATGERYRGSYFAKYGPATWAQGDFISMNAATGGFVMHGRSDGVLNPAGVRFGSAEIYNVLAREGGEATVDSLCVGQRRAGDADETVVLFVQLARGRPLTRPLAARLRERISSLLSPRHAPRYIFAVPEVPYTVNGKKVEAVVKKIISGHKVVISPTIANPHCLEFFEQFVNIEEAHARQLRTWKEAKL
ncbi:hypothetical protein BJY00DRAFT_301689 [Aspergillus carlsbadensis]|nr:hypothetical protein BJY00DRAFT_301689 [Aspergillus carlsbadensis]